MNLAELTTGNVYVDVNIFYMFLRKDVAYSPVIRSFLERIARGYIHAYTSVLALDELYYRLLLAQIKDTYQQSPLEILRQTPQDAIKRCAPAVVAALQCLMQLPGLQVTEVQADDVMGMLDNSPAFGLLPRDALHLSVMQRLHLNAIATDDTDFDQISGVQRYGVFHA